MLHLYLAEFKCVQATSYSDIVNRLFESVAVSSRLILMKFNPCRSKMLDHNHSLPLINCSNQALPTISRHFERLQRVEPVALKGVVLASRLKSLVLAVAYHHIQHSCLHLCGAPSHRTHC